MLRSNEALAAEQEVPSEGRAATGMLLATCALGRLWWLLGGGHDVADRGRQHGIRGPAKLEGATTPFWVLARQEGTAMATPIKNFGKVETWLINTI